MSRVDKVKSLFSLPPDKEKLDFFRKIPSPKNKYIIAFTPRSGSSYFCDLLSMSGSVGKPGEYLNPDFIPDILRSIPGKNMEEYIINVLKKHQSRNGISGFKVSWFQFRIALSIVGSDFFDDFKFIYLYRRDIYNQSVSLYIATESGQFHTNTEIDFRKRENVRYDFDKIKFWFNHIKNQELGWKNFFKKNKIFPLVITYEDILDDPLGCIEMVYHFLGLDKFQKNINPGKSKFKKLGNLRDLEWSRRFLIELKERNL